MDISNFGSSTYSWPKNTSEKIAELSIYRHSICNEDKTVIANQHNKGKLTARERIDFLLDPGTFEELGAFVSHDHGKSPSCVITGYGQIEGRPVYVISQNSSTSNIFRAEIYSKKICHIIDLSLKNGCPIVSLNDFGESGSQCIGEETIGTFAEIFLRSTLASGVVPQVSAIMGPYLGHVAFTSAISDFTFMVQQSSYMSLTNPRFHNSAPLEGVAVEEFGEASAHAKKSGMAHFICLNDLDCIRKIRRLLSFVSANNLEESPRV